MFSGERVKALECRRCIKIHCLKRDKSSFQEGFSCYEPSKCAECLYYAFCHNPCRDKIPRDSAGAQPILKPDGSPICFIPPASCDSCFLSTGHCKNAFLPGKKDFSWNPNEGITPECFSNQHSRK